MVAFEMIDKSRFEAVLFDNDGVLVDTEQYYVLACQRMVAEMFGLELSLDDYQDYGYTKGIGTTGWLLERGIGEGEIEEYKVRRDELYEEFLNQGNAPMEGVLELLDFLEKKKIPRAVVTATFRKHLEIAHSYTGILDKVLFAVTNEDTEREKPFPDGYLLAAKKLGVDPARCLVIEDSPRGIAAGKNAGMTVWAIPTRQTRDLDLSRADKVWNGAGEVLEELKKSLFD